MVLGSLWAILLPAGVAAHPTGKNGDPPGTARDYGLQASELATHDLAAALADTGPDRLTEERRLPDHWHRSGDQVQFAWGAQTPSASAANAELNGPGAGDALGAALRQTLNESGRENQPSLPPRASEAAALPGGESVPSAGEQIVVAVQGLQVSVAEAVIDALDARVDREGTVRFALAGIEGFRLAQSPETVTLGFGDDSVQIVQYGSGAHTPHLQPGAARDVPPNSAPPQFNPLREVLDLLREIAQYPLVWLLALFLLIGKFAISIAERHSRQSRHRKHAKPQSGSRELKRSRSRHHQRVPTHTGVPTHPSRQEPEPAASADYAASYTLRRRRPSDPPIECKYPF